jgi:arylsulfatase A-like enzyme
MNNSKYILVVIPFFMVLLHRGLAAGKQIPKEPDKPNIIFIIADDMTPDMFNFLREGQGQNLTPNLDALAAEGTVLLGQHVASPLCTPSRFSCLTGKYASRASNKEFTELTEKSGKQTVVQLNTMITPANTTLPELLKNDGYITGAVGKNHVIKIPGYYKAPWKADPNDKLLKTNLQKNAEAIRNAFKACGFDYAESIYNKNLDSNGPKELAVHNLDWIVKGGLDFIEENKGHPFFLYFATTVTHGPGEAERSWAADRRKIPLGILNEPVQLLSDKETIKKRLLESGLKFPGNKFNKKANLLWLDDAVGALMNKIKEAGIAKNTIIFFFNDHGQDAKGSIYQGGVSNPSIIWKKGGFKCGPVNKVFLSNVDFAPTILSMAGVPYSQSQFDGKSFLPVLQDNYKETHSSLYFELGYSRGIRLGKFKYIALRYPRYAVDMSLEDRKKILQRVNQNLQKRGRPIITEDPSKPFSHMSLKPGGGDAERTSTAKYKYYYSPDQFYNIKADPGEQRNLIDDPDYQDEITKLKERLKQYINDLPGHFNL